MKPRWEVRVNSNGTTDRGDSMKKLFLIGLCFLNATASFASSSCHSKAQEKIEGIQGRQNFTRNAAIGLAAGGLLPGFGVVWFTFPAGPAIYGGLMGGAAISGATSLYYSLRERGVILDDLKFQLLEDSNAQEIQSEELSYYYKSYLYKAQEKREKFIRKVMKKDPTLSVDEIAYRFSELDSKGEVCTSSGRYYADWRIAKKIVNFNE